MNRLQSQSSSSRLGITSNFQRRAPNYLVSCRLNNEGVFLVTEKCDYRQATRSFLRALDLVEHDPKQTTMRKKMFETYATWSSSQGESRSTGTRHHQHEMTTLSSSTKAAGDAKYDHGLDQYRTYYRLNDPSEANSTAKILFNLGRVFHDQGRFDMAVNFYTQLLQERRDSSNDEKLLCLAGLFSMGHCQYSRGDLHALPTYWAALSVAQTLGERHHQATCMNAIGMVILSMPTGKQQVALQAFQTSLEIRRQCLREDDVEIGTTWNNIGHSYYKQQNYPKALEAYNQALRVRRLNRDAPDGIDVAATLLNLGQVCYQMKKYKQALRYYEDFLRLAKIHFGENHEDVCNVTTCVGQVLQALGQLERSLRAYQDALTIAKILYLPIDASIASIQKKIATVYYFTKNYDLALKTYHAALEVELQIYDRGDSKILISYSNIAETHKERGEFDLSLKFHEQVLQAQKTSNDASAKHQMEVATTLQRIANVHYRKGDYGRALEFQQECLLIQREQNGDDAHDVAMSLFQIGRLLLQLDSSKMALEAMLEACRIQKKIHKEDRQSITALRHVASTYRQQGCLDAALGCYHEAARIQRAILGTDHADFGDILFNISLIYHEKGELEISLKLLRQVLESEGRCFGARDHRCFRTLILIGEIETHLGNLPELMETFSDVLRIYQADDRDDDHVLAHDATLWRFDKVLPPGAGAA